MKREAFVLLVLIFVSCSYCAKQFASTAGLNRHAWRCKAKLANNSPRVPEIVPSELPAQACISTVTCVCGRICNGFRGLKAHQRSCRTIDSINQAPSNPLIGSIEAGNYESNAEDIADTPITSLLENAPELKTGVNLPRNEADWATANSYFHATLPFHEIKRDNLDTIVLNLHNHVYDYFASRFGTKESNSRKQRIVLAEYNSLTKTNLKKELKNLKDRNEDPETIKIVSKLLRSKITKATAKQDIYSKDHDQEIRKSFWHYCKKFIEPNIRVLPSFTKEICETFFLTAFKRITTRSFSIPDWIPRLNQPNFQFDVAPPTYKEICKIINRMKSSSSPCPVDQISVICFKRCPYLRSYITAVCSQVLASQLIPSPWRRATSILIHKQGDTDDPANFRPITLEPTTLKIFTSLVRNRIFTFLVRNGYAESHIQKGFIPGLSGTLEHIASTAFLINHARQKQRSITITLLDLKNAFGEVDHSLVAKILQYHHIPDHISFMINILYSDFSSAVITNSFVTRYIPVQKGVLQGDCLSPLLFNMLMNTFVQYIKGPDFLQFGYSFSALFSHRNWLQFADDAAAISGLESENQTLLNAFSRWCKWSGMTVRVDKCHTFGIKKVNGSSKQVKPKVYINNQRIKPVEIDGSFTYLGRSFNFDMSGDSQKVKLADTFSNLLEIINNLPLHPRNKLLIYQRYVLSKISWDLTVSELTETWIKQSLDSKLRSYLRLWLDIPICGTLDIITLTKKHYGLNICLVSEKFIQCQVAYRQCLAK